MSLGWIKEKPRGHNFTEPTNYDIAFELKASAIYSEGRRNGLYGRPSDKICGFVEHDENTEFATPLATA